MQFRKYTKQRNGSIQGLRSFKDTLPKNIKKFISKRGQIYSEILNNWKHIVGENLFKVCYPKSYKNSNKFGVVSFTIAKFFFQEIKAGEGSLSASFGLILAILECNPIMELMPPISCNVGCFPLLIESRNIFSIV